MCRCIHTHVCIHIQIYIYIYTYTYIYIYIYTHTYIHIYIYIYIYGCRPIPAPLRKIRIHILLEAPPFFIQHLYTTRIEKANSFSEWRPLPFLYSSYTQLLQRRQTPSNLIQKSLPGIWLVCLPS